MSWTDHRIIGWDGSPGPQWAAIGIPGGAGVPKRAPENMQ
jgi:hypothetical protein